ncbi:hypothetical protein M378DRAFT_161684 [Amanita muscaria Koide BX008]|uniref:Uncharacterized protein n=1 Tax=Amanita muscaria (strain Koide BX008) TaxID=946122 RepID=A0A0C2XA81_AMAMK|nr:hypothetical protein M378DRAFT_161684 [Amanita muscaria Koide BX008]
MRKNLTEYNVNDHATRKTPVSRSMFSHCKPLKPALPMWTFTMRKRRLGVDVESTIPFATVTSVRVKIMNIYT